MQMKHIVIGAGIAIVVIIGAFVARNQFSSTATPSDTAASQGGPTLQHSAPDRIPEKTSAVVPPVAEGTTQTSPVGDGQPVTPPAPIKTDVGTVAGVDLSIFADEANQSAARAAQDGAADTKTVAADSKAIGTSTAANPLQ